MPAWKHVAPELIAECKYLYEETLTPTHEIGARLGLSRTAFYLRVRDWNWQPRRYRRGLVEDIGAPANTGHLPPQTEMAESPVPAEAEQDGAPETRPELAVRISKRCIGKSISSNAFRNWHGLRTRRRPNVRRASLRS